MRKRFDWKFLLTLLFTAASVIVPVWLWQADLSSKAVKLTIRSVVEMQPRGLAPLEGVQVSIDGKILSSPFVSVLELSNSGAKPILPSDFEGPLRIVVANPAKVVKTQLGATTPPTLEPKISLVEGSIRIQPLLLNPGDIIRLTLVTANAKPEYSVRGRIAGVTEIPANDAQSARTTKRYWISTIAAASLLVIYMVNMFEFAFSILRRRFIPSSLATGLVTCFGAVLILQISAEDMTVLTLWPIVAFATLASIPFTVGRTRPQIPKPPEAS